MKLEFKISMNKKTNEYKVAKNIIFKKKYIYNISLHSLKYNICIKFKNRIKNVNLIEYNKKISDITQIKNFYKINYTNIDFDKINVLIDILYISNEFDLIDISENFLYIIIKDKRIFNKILKTYGFDDIGKKTDCILKYFNFIKYDNIDDNEFVKDKLIYYNYGLINIIINKNLYINNFKFNFKNDCIYISNNLYSEEYYNNKKFFDIFILNKLFIDTFIESFLNSFIFNNNISLNVIVKLCINKIKKNLYYYNINNIIKIINSNIIFEIFEYKINFILILILYYCLMYTHLASKNKLIDIKIRLSVNLILFNLNMINNIINNNIDDFINHYQYYYILNNIENDYKSCNKIFYEIFLDYNIIDNDNFTNIYDNINILFNILFNFNIDEIFSNHLYYNINNKVYFTYFTSKTKSMLNNNIYNFLNDSKLLKNYLEINNNLIDIKNIFKLT